MKKIVNGICVVLAFICVGLGAVGIVFSLGIFFSPLFAKVVIIMIAAIHFYVLIFRIKTVEVANE